MHILLELLKTKLLDLWLGDSENIEENDELH